MKVVIEHDNVWAKPTTPSAASAIKPLVTYRQSGFQFVPAYKRGFWDGYVSLMKPDGRFPAGLVPYVVNQLYEQNIIDNPDDVGIIDARGLGPPIDYCIRPAKSKFTLMKHQLDAIKEGIEYGRGVFEHAVGAGKSFELIELVRAVGCQALILVHTKDLMYQIAEDFKEQLDIPGLIGICGDGTWEPHCITVATFQTINRRRKDYPKDVLPWLAEIGQVHVDEAHHLSAETFGDLMAHMPNAYWRFGYSATPFKTDDTESMLKVQAHLGPILHTFTPAEGVESGRLVPVDLFAVKVEGWQPEPAYEVRKGKRVQVKPFGYDQAVQSLLVDHEWRNLAICKLAERFRALGTTLVFVDRLEHGNLLAGALDAPFLEGDMKGRDRKKAWDALRCGDLDLAIVTKIADEGLNIPNVRYLILAGGGKAGHKIIQRLGRGRRSVEDKERLFAVDFLDQGMNLGPHTRARLAAYKSDPSITLAEVTLDDLLEALA